MSSDDRLKTISVLLVGAVILSSSLAGYYFYQFSLVSEAYSSTLESLDGLSYEIDLIINFGNGSKSYFNQTIIPIGFNMYNATLFATDGRVDATYFPEFDAHFVNSIMGLGGDEGFGWSAWAFDERVGEWRGLDVGADLFILKDGQSIAWFYQSFNNFGQSKPN